ncbi:hypothetical protein [Gimesia algae]|nr:hypothetical protein [Gimesia algae]
MTQKRFIESEKESGTDFAYLKFVDESRFSDSNSAQNCRSLAGSTSS